MMSEKLKLPWRVEEGLYRTAKIPSIHIVDGNDGLVCDCYNKATAKAIVLAVNSHDDMKESVEFNEEIVVANAGIIKGLNEDVNSLTERLRIAEDALEKFGSLEDLPVDPNCQSFYEGINLQRDETKEEANEALKAIKELEK